MNRIEMYSSSRDLRVGLHRVLATSHALNVAAPLGENDAWWQSLDSCDGPAAQSLTLSLEQLARAYAQESYRTALDGARLRLGLKTLDHEDVAAAFRAAVVSGRAHRAHMGRDVYGATNKRLWDLVCADMGVAVATRFGPSLGEPSVVPGAELAADAEHLLEALVAFDTSPDGGDHAACIDWLVEQLGALGFDVDVVGKHLGPPLLVARRGPRGLAGHVVLYGHYDVTPFGREERWVHPPRRLTASEGRLFGRGVADNKGPLAARLVALANLEQTPALTWLIQGEEETGSSVAKALLPAVMEGLDPTLWLDETGYHDHEDGTLRLLARTIGPDGASAAVDADMHMLLRGLGCLASRWGVASRHERRGLNKNVVEGGCPFNHALPVGARYLSIGVNDSAARIHGINESIPAWTFPLHQAECEVIFRWTDWVTRGRV